MKKVTLLLLIAITLSGCIETGGYGISKCEAELEDAQYMLRECEKRYY